MIITVTLNPSLDRTLRFERVQRGHLNRAEEVHEDVSGKGINVSLALQQLGQPSLVIALVAGRTGQRVADGLARQGLECRLVWLESGETRISTKVHERAFGTLTELNEPGPLVSPDDLQAVLHTIQHAVSPGDTVVFSGSIPPGCPADFYARAGKLLRQSGVTVVVDTSGPALQHSVAIPPQLLKPNLDELSQLVGRPLAGWEDILEAGNEAWQRLRVSSGAGHADCYPAQALIVTLGAQGALFYTAQGLWHAVAPEERGGTTAGCGDALLAATLYGLEAGWEWEAIIPFATATAAATAAIVGTRFPERAEAERRLASVQVRRLEGL